jgi:hypothetical protein
LLLKELKKETKKEISQIEFKIFNEDGTERRMTSQEKKLAKFQRSQEKKAAKKRKREEAEQQRLLQFQRKKESGLEWTAESSNEQQQSKDSKKKSNDRYYQLSINNTVLMQELAELRGERNGLPPVLLSPAMAHQAILQGAFSLAGNTTNVTINNASLTYDHKLSMEWARLLKESMVPDEEIRAKESIRPMPYQLIPEPWTRLRPSGFQEEHTFPTQLRSLNSASKSTSGSNSRTLIPPQNCNFASVCCRPPTNFDSIVSLVFEYFYKSCTDYYVSCGAKFGCDFLIYDGPREERHAFAGIRVHPATNEKLPIPTTYSLAGLVRCLNTAGKFALLATMVSDYDKDTDLTTYRVAIVDVALEKILSAPTHKKRNQTQSRRDVTANLAK